MTEKPHYLTAEGLHKLEKQLEFLTSVKRAEVAERLKQALEDGGELTENSEYEDAKNEQAFVEAEIARISQILRNARLIEESNHSTDCVRLGSRVRIIDQESKEEEVYILVGSAEADPREHKISDESPLGKALLGAKVGDKVRIKAPDGDLVFIIKNIA
ncbi:MAG: transcription elongation factor GreA [Anaerolineae bacterium]|nr:transcription elongation factor GreA [Anaerolineae bacterium]MDW8172057.1 transcription elongation factor GreA [Anaerolineae bacterium]